MGKRRAFRLGGLCAVVVFGFTYLQSAPSQVQSVRYVPRGDAPEPRLAADIEGPRSLPDDADTLQLTGLQQKFEAISRRVGPTVVSISATTQVMEADDASRHEDITSEKLESMLDKTTRMVGTGFIVDSNGYILTNEHVIGEAETIWITTDDRKVYPAIVVGSDPRSDLAILKIAAKKLPAVHFAPYNSVRRGQWSIALGNPYGLATEGCACMSVGIISALERSLPKLSRKENRLYTNLIQTTAQINPGNSGGPLFDLNGDVIGLNTAVILPEKKANGIGFAIPITPQFVAAVHDLMEGREIVYGYLGVMVSTATVRERQQAHVEGDYGVRIDTVESDSPAGEHGLLKEQDVIVQVNGELVRDNDHFVRIIGCTPAEKEAKLTVYRGGKPCDVSITLRRRQMLATGVTRERQRFHWQGMLLGPIPANWSFSKTERPSSGLMVLGISPSSPFCKEQVAQGDVITAVAGQPIPNVTVLQKVLSEAPASKCRITIAGRADAVVTISE